MKSFIPILLLLCCSVLLSFGCNEDDPCKNYECPIIADYPYSQICVVIDDKPECKDACRSDKEGESDPYCMGNGADDPEFHSVSSYVSTCAKDPQGRSYIVSNKSTLCSNGCNFDTGLCNE